MAKVQTEKTVKIAKTMKMNKRSQQSTQNEISQLSIKDYHARSELSASGIKLLLENPYLFLHNEPKVQTQDMLLGTVIHKLLLEPELFDSEYAVSPKLDLRTKAGKESKAVFESKHAGKVCITTDMFDTAESCVNSILQSNVSRLLDGGVAEHSFFGKLGGVGAKCRPDYYVESKGLVIDIKKITDASVNGFARAAGNFKYHVQAAWYKDLLLALGKPVNAFIFIVVEATAPFMVGIYKLSDNDMALGQLQYQEAIRILNNIDKFKLPVYRDTQTNHFIQTVHLPAYARNQNPPAWQTHWNQLNLGAVNYAN